MIPVPLDHMPPFLEYIEAMGEGYISTSRGTNFRVLGRNAMMKAVYCPSVEEKVADITEAIELARANHIAKIDFVEHPLNTFNIDELREINANTKNNMLSYGRVVKMATFLIDTEDTNWTPNKKVRQNCRNFEKLGCRIEQMTAFDIPFYHNLYINHRKELSLDPWPEGCFNIIGAWLGSYSFGLKALDSNGNMLAAMSFLLGKDWVEEVHVARISEEGENLPHCYLIEPIRMKAIDIARTLGHRYYDLGGVSPCPMTGSKEESIRRSKEKYNGVYCEFQRYLLDVI